MRSHLELYTEKRRDVCQEKYGEKAKWHFLYVISEGVYCLLVRVRKEHVQPKIPGK